MAQVLVLMHTVPMLLPVFSRLCAEMLPGVRIFHILDEPLLERLKQRGHLAPEDSERLLQHAALAQQIGACLALVTCSSISPAVDSVRPRAPIPILKIDEAMVARAVEIGGRIGVVATAPTTLEPTRQALQAEATRRGRKVAVELVLVEGAMPALLAGDVATHDSLVRASVLTLQSRVDAVVLAQASMARVLEVLPEAERSIPVLSSPHLALERVRSSLGESRSGH